MSQYKDVPVEVAAKISDSYGKDIVVICCWSHAHELLHTTTYGRAPGDKVSAATAGEICARALGTDLQRSMDYEDFRKDLDAGKQRAMEEAIKKHLPALEKMAGQVIDPPNNVFAQMASDLRRAMGK